MKQPQTGTACGTFATSDTHRQTSSLICATMPSPMWRWLKILIIGNRCKACRRLITDDVCPSCDLWQR
jgi:hypothetical protein